MNTRSSVSRAIALLLVLLIAAPQVLLAVGPAPELPNPGSTGVSKEEQEQLGQKVVAEVYKQMPVLPDSSPVTRYVQQLGRKLETVIPQEYSWPYQFHVVQQKEINAFALPGGPVFVNVGTILSAENEAQLAGVMAHEMAHVYMQHSIKGAQKQGLAQGLGQLLGGILGSAIGGTAGALAQLGGNIGGGLLSMKYSRQDEAQADSVGAIIMYKAGYDPRAMAQFFQKLAAEGSSGPQFLSDHPNPGNRYSAVSNQVRNWPPKNFRSNSSQFQQASQQARSVRAYTAQEIAQMAKTGQIHNTDTPAGVPAGQGTMQRASASDVMPSGSFQRFEQGGISLQYPSNWQVFRDQQGNGVTFAPQAGVSDSGVAYGVVINSVPSQAASLDDATRQLVASLQQSNPGLQAMGSPENIRVNGVGGKSVDMRGNSPIQGERERDWLVVLPTNNGGLLSVVFVSPERDYARLRPTYEQMLRSLHLQQ